MGLREHRLVERMTAIDKAIISATLTFMGAYVVTMALLAFLRDWYGLAMMVAMLVIASGSFGVSLLLGRAWRDLG